MPIPTTGLCHDEDVALRVGDDFARVAPLDQVIAAGNDGAFLNTDRWTLGSASVDFVAQGVVANMVAVVTIPQRLGVAPNTQVLAVASVGMLGMTLRRKGMAIGAGQPPGPTAGSSGVQFTVATLTPQILRATYEIDRRFGIDDAQAGRRTLDLYDPDELRSATVLTVLWKLYETAARCGSADAKDGESAALWAKARSAKAELDEVIARLALRWQSITSTGVTSAPTTRFGMRLTR